MSVLDVTDAARLTRLEIVIENGIQTFMKVGRALEEIRDRHLYRETHEAFEDYCRERWGFSDRRARQLMAATCIGTIVPVENEGQARELVPLIEEPELLNEAWEEAVHVSNGKPTAAVVKEAVKRRRITDDDRKEILRLREQGKTQKQIADFTGWSQGTVGKTLAKLPETGRLSRRRQAATAQTRALAKINQACRDWDGIGDEEYIPAPEIARRIRVLDAALAFLTTKRDAYKEAPNGSRNS